MRTTAFLLVFSASLLIGEAPAASLPTRSSTVKEESIFKRKKKGYRRKKGFMWGLFKKKDCGCPKF
ncbi:hypothetical protein [Fibrivirga algicola]|uniref:Uncharacterized protein n=1 Tax=Fibrivirga algicola TaxID=2950420 RepID=A0ABX0QL83_9BACT|nr:hypothetical protein [Fibrivirga algicola]ARK09984.1 hypothetical protein A6C57_06310 [Fibrella sp. ES10-3-2-2]NID11578.1 hypothetical protein [Fibrivirga algicola]